MTDTAARKPHGRRQGASLSGTPAGMALRALLRADTVVLLHNRVSVVLSILLPLVILVATKLGNAPSRLGKPRHALASPNKWWAWP